MGSTQFVEPWADVTLDHAFPTRHGTLEFADELRDLGILLSPARAEIRVLVSRVVLLGGVCFGKERL